MSRRPRTPRVHYFSMPDFLNGLRIPLAALLLLALAIALSVQAPAHEAHDRAAIAQVMRAEWEKPESPLAVEPIVISGHHAVAGWAQGDLGGRALLQKAHGKWRVVLCTGDELRTEAFMRGSGVPASAAAALARSLMHAELSVPMERRKMFASFQGIVRMDEHSNHPPAAKGHQQAQMSHGAMKADAPSGKTYKAGSLTIETPWSRATPGGAKVAGGYLRITNHGSAADRLVGGSSTVAERFEIHEMSVTDGVMRMRPLKDGLEIAPGATVELKPGGYHVMFLDLNRPLKEGETVKGTLVFEKAGTVEIEYGVAPIGASSQGSHGGPDTKGHAPKFGH